MMNVKIGASMMCADFTRLGQQIEELQGVGVDLLHWDVMDGLFVHNFALSPDIIAACRARTSLPFDAHLCITDPSSFITEVAQAGADIIEVQLETTLHVHRAVERIHALGKRAGVVLSPSTPLSFLETILQDLDIVTLMTVDAGFAGQSFIWPALEKVRALRKLVLERKLRSDIQVDGQINATSIAAAVRAGANVLVVGTSGLFAASENLQQAMRGLRAHIAEANVS